MDTDRYAFQDFHDPKKPVDNGISAEIKSKPLQFAGCQGADADGDYFMAWLRECHREANDFQANRFQGKASVAWR